MRFSVHELCTLVVQDTRVNTNVSAGPNSLGRTSPSLPGVPGAVVESSGLGAGHLGGVNATGTNLNAPGANVNMSAPAARHAMESAQPTGMRVDAVSPAGVGIGGGAGKGMVTADAPRLTNEYPAVDTASRGGVTASMSDQMRKQQIHAIPGLAGHRSACECNRCMAIRRQAAPQLFADK